MKFEVRTRKENVMSDKGKMITRHEMFLIEANLFAEAELKALEQAGSDADVYSIRRVKIDEVFNQDKMADGKDWYKAIVVKYYTMDDGSVKESRWNMLCPATDTTDANNQVVEMLRQGYDFTIHTISKTRYTELVDII